MMQIVPEDSCILYLWQNEPTVVIGRNQNPWKECRTSLLQENGVHLARRYSGGGAVYHDLGNMNFTFVAKESCYDQDKNFAVIKNACERLGIQIELSGRNDLLANGFKFSGNAFLHQNGAACHHGTLLIDSDFSKLSDYLTPPKAKLQAKGITSVRSRVTNLKEISPDITVNKMRQALLEAFDYVYCGNATPLPLSDNAQTTLNEKKKALSDPNWLYGNRIAMTYSVEDKFPWGYICIDFQVTSGVIDAVAVYTDSLDWTLSETIQKALTGIPFQKAKMLNAIKNKIDDTILADISALLNI
jgi:lipoate-protein ligase A